MPASACSRPQSGPWRTSWEDREGENTLNAPIRFSGKEIYLKIANDGRGEGTEVIIDEQTTLDLDGEWATLPYEKIGERSVVEVRF